MKLCGVELKANNAIFSVFEKNDDDIVIYIDLKIKKITLDDDESFEDIKTFSNNVNDFLKDNKIEKVFIKKRAKKGNFAGGAVTFKMEGIIQLNDICDVTLVSSQSVNSFEKKNMIEFPKELKKYQEGAYLTALAAA
ncbi:DUF3010 family protein [Arcobacter sp. YIC-80]|uniref:DUF3010 family protein n=1 Tax=Arcobacter sp. YIC-80 TaxID=3376683 RepID=UPI00384D012F